MCSRRQKKIFQTLFFLTIVFGFLYGLLLYYEMHSQLKKSENLAFKYQQHQEALSAQLQGKRTAPTCVCVCVLLVIPRIHLTRRFLLALFQF